MVPPSAPPAPVRLAPADRVRLREAIAEGRRLSRAGDHTAALVSFDAALALDPGSSRLRCETGYVAFRAGQLDRAESLVTVAVRAFLGRDEIEEAMRVPVAMCLYNAGLVYEARGRTLEARTVFERSIALRPNRIVSEHLAALAPTAATTTTMPTTTWAPDLAWSDLGRRLLATFCARGNGGFDGDDAEVRATCEGSGIAPVPVPGTPTGGIEAAIVDGAFLPGDGEVLFSALAVRGAGTLFVAELANGYSPGVAGMSVDITAEGRFEDVLPGGTAELVVRWSFEATSYDAGYCQTSSGGAGSTIVCSTDFGTLRCASVLDSSWDFEESEPCDDVWGDEGEDGSPGTDRAGFRTEPTFEHGTVDFEPMSGYPDIPEELLEPIDLRTLLLDPEQTWPGTSEPIEVVAG